MALCTIFTILLTLWNSEEKNGLLINLFCFSSDFDETWWSCSTQVYYNFAKFPQNWMKNKKVFLIACVSLQNFKVSVELLKSYIVREWLDHIHTSTNIQVGTIILHLIFYIWNSMYFANETTFTNMQWWNNLQSHTVLKSYRKKRAKLNT